MKTLWILLLFGAAAMAQDPPMGVLADIGIDQKLGAQVPMDLIFKDSAGMDLRLGSLFRGKPAVLSLVYYECPMLCSLTLNGVVKGLRPLKFSVGTEFDIITISFDPKETADLAASRKSHYVAEYGRPDAASGWHFLTGSSESIKNLTEAVGYRFVRDVHTQQWAHASAILVLTPEGRISQVLYGIEFSARDLRLSLIEASRYRIGTLVDRILLYCYHYDPETGKYGFVIMNILRAACFGTVLAVAAFVVLNRRS